MTVTDVPSESYEDAVREPLTALLNTGAYTVKFRMHKTGLNLGERILAASWAGDILVLELENHSVVLAGATLRDGGVALNISLPHERQSAVTAVPDADGATLSPILVNNLTVAEAAYRERAKLAEHIALQLKVQKLLLGHGPLTDVTIGREANNQWIALTFGQGDTTHTVRVGVINPDYDDFHLYAGDVTLDI